MTGRKYVLSRVGAGDYLLPSNDETTLWRLLRLYEDGSATDGDGRQIRGHFWSAYYYRGTLAAARAEIDRVATDDDLRYFLDLGGPNWMERSGGHPTRRAALEVALRSTDGSSSG